MVRVRVRARADLPGERELCMVPRLLLRRALPAGGEVAPRLGQLLRLPPQPRVQALRRYRVDARLEVELALRVGRDLRLELVRSAALEMQLRLLRPVAARVEQLGLHVEELTLLREQRPELLDATAHLRLVGEARGELPG